MTVLINYHKPIVQPVNATATGCMMSTTLAIFFYETGARELAFDRLIDTFSLTPAAFIGEVGARGWVPAFVTLLTYQFFHADLAHIVGNMVFLWVFGDDVERALGRARYLAFYLLCGATGGLVFVANDPHSTIELIGASGAVAGVVVGYVMLRPCAKITVLLGVIPLRISAYWVVGLFVVSQLWNLGASSKSEVAYWCHFGGMLGGAVLFPLLKPRAVRLFRCLQPVPDTVVQIGPQRAGPAARVNDLR